MGSQPPTGSLNAAARVARDPAECHTALYQALLAGYVADRLKAGKPNLPHRLSYRAFETYLLDESPWRTTRLITKKLVVR